jgi:hypothetical protein
LRIWIALLCAALAVGMRTDISQRRARIIRNASDRVEASDRYVDIGVTLKVVRADERGETLVEGGQKMVVVGRPHPFGGIVDTKSNPPRIVGLSQNPQVWLCSEDQFRVIRHADTEPVGKLALGGMGAGKTTAGVIWVYLRWIENLVGRAADATAARERAQRANDPSLAVVAPQNEMGVTAPTETRLSLVFNEIFKLFPSHWWRYNSETKIMTLCDGFRVRGVSTHRQSASAGSRLQAFNWVALLADELQDSIDEFIHMMARLRSKQDGRAKRLATATAKDFPEWRALKDNMLQSGVWQLHSLLGPSSPFVHPDHWNAMKRQMTDRDYRRLVMAEDLPSESRLYHTFDRKENVRPIPIGARKITSVVLSRKTGNPRHALLIGHDPGSAKAGSVYLDAYDVKGEVWWFVRGELFTLHETAEQHAMRVLDRIRRDFGVNTRPDAEIAHVRAQPVGQAEDKPDLDVFRIWRRVGFDIKAAQYKKDGTGTGQIKKESRIGMVNTLFCDALGRRRLFIECDDRGVPVAPLLVSALETMERDEKGRAEHEEKHVRHDKSDLPAALGYGLHPFEKESATALRSDIQRGLG